MLIKSYINFLNEWEKHRHYVERTTPDDKENRIVPYSDNMIYGWKLFKFIEVDEKGNNMKKHIKTEDFVMKSMQSIEEINTKISKSLRMLTWSLKIPQQKLAMSKDFSVYLGKLVFPIKSIEKDERGADIEKTIYFSPSLQTEKGNGNEIWATIKSNVGYTILYLQEPTENELIKRAYENRSIVHNGLSVDEYVKHVYKGRTNLFSKNFFLMIPDTKDWEEKVKTSADTGIIISDQEVDIMTPEEIAWKSLLIDDSTSVFDVGTKIVHTSPTGEKTIREIAELLIKIGNQFKGAINPLEATHYRFKLGQNFGFSSIPSHGNIDFAIKDDKKIREIGSNAGKIPLKGGQLVKTLNIRSYRKAEGKRTAFGAITNYYVI